MATVFKRPMIKTKKGHNQYLKQALAYKIDTMQKDMNKFNKSTLTRKIKNFNNNSEKIKRALISLKGNKNDNLIIKQKLANNIISMQKAINTLKGTKRPVIKSRKHINSIKTINSLLKLPGHYNPISKKLPHRKVK